MLTKSNSENKRLLPKPANKGESPGDKAEAKSPAKPPKGQKE